MLQIRGRVLVDDEREVDRMWAVDGRVTFIPPPGRRADDVVTLQGRAVPGLVDVHCHIGLAATGSVPAAAAERQAVADRDTGTLLVRDAGSPSDTRWMDGRPDLPRILRAGHHLARPKRYLRYCGRELHDVGQLPQAVAEEVGRGDGWVKLVAD